MAFISHFWALGIEILNNIVYSHIKNYWINIIIDK